MARYLLGNDTFLELSTAAELWHEVHAAEKRGQASFLVCNTDIRNLLQRMQKLEQALQFADNELDYYGAKADGATRTFIQEALNFPVPVAPEIQKAA